MPDGTQQQNLAQTLTGVEIFRSGRWNGEPYSVQDLADMVDAFAGVGYRPPVKLGHGSGDSDPAYGWVTNLRVDGDRLIADFADVPDELVGMIRDKRYDAVSSEIFFDLERDGQKFRRALKAVAIIGADVPGVSDLKPLSDSVPAFGQAAATRRCTEFQEEQRMPAEKQDGAAEAKAEVARLLAELTKLREADVARAAEVKQLREDAAAARERERQARIKALAESCTLPALRDHVTALADVVTREGTKVVKFGQADKAAEVEPLAVVEKAVAVINGLAKRLFSELSAGASGERGEGVGDDPGAQLDAKVKAHAAAHKLDYGKAMAAVLADPANAELKRAYAQH